jgi:predicted lipase
MSDFDVLDPLKKVPAFYGIVVSQISNPTNRVVAFRGTQGKIEWLDDATAIVQVPFLPLHNGGMVGLGFGAIYSSLKIVPVPIITSNTGPAAAATPKLTGTFAEQLDQRATHEETRLGITQKSAVDDQRPTGVTGHSLGSALATLFAFEGSAKKLFNIQLVSTLASPKVGNAKFVQSFNALSFTSWRIFNIPDAVPKLPLSIGIIDFEAVDTGYSFDSSSFARQNEGCYHSIDTYLHGLDDTWHVAPECALIVVSQTAQ